MVFEVAQLQPVHGFQNFHQQFVALNHRTAQLVAVHIYIVEQAFEIVFAVKSLGRVFYVLKYIAQGFVQVGIVAGIAAYIHKQIGRQDIKTLFFYGVCSAKLSFGIGQLSVIEIRVSGTVFFPVEVRSEVFRYKPVKQKSQHVRFEIPSIHCSPQVVSNLPYSTVKLIPLLFFGHNLIII